MKALNEQFKKDYQIIACFILLLIYYYYLYEIK